MAASKEIEPVPGEAGPWPDLAQDGHSREKSGCIRNPRHSAWAMMLLPFRQWDREEPGQTECPHAISAQVGVERRVKTSRESQ
jgi:hypothetical protein